MARFYGHLGYAEDRALRPGVHQEVMVEYPYFGSVTQDIFKSQTSEQLHDDVVLQNLISVVGDKYAFEHYFKIRYVRWDGALWKVNYVEIQRPRLLLRFGGVYNGETAATAPGSC